MSPTPLLQLHELDLALGGRAVLQGLSLSLSRGEALALIGPSGCGKSSLLRLLGGLLAPGRGRGRVEGRVDECACVFQQPRLLPWASLLDNIALPLRLRGQGRAAARGAAAPLLQRVGLAGFERALPHQLSGGMQMRAALARALITEPELLLLDEPLGALDEISREQLGHELRGWWDERPAMASVLVTHSVFEAVALADRLLVLSPRPARLLHEIELAGVRAATAGPWTESDAYFERVREAQRALARGLAAC